MCNAWNHSDSCTCGFGGIGHLGRSGGSWASHNYIVVSGSCTTWRLCKDDFCKPTSCPICGAEVFFVRHNGGSVWFDELGQPWPKHGCFDTDISVRQTTWRLLTAAESVRAPLYGIVIEVETDADGFRNRIVVKCEDNKLATTFVSGHNSLSSLVGELVVLSREDKKILHPNISASSNFAFPATAEQYYNLGKIYVKLGCANDAIEAFTVAVNLKANFGEVYVELGKIYQEMRRYLWIGTDESIRMKQNVVEVYFLAGEAFRKTGQFKEALEAYKQARLINPNYPELCFHIGEILLEIGEYKSAANAFKQAIRIKPNHSGAHQSLQFCRSKHIPEKDTGPQPTKRPRNEKLGKRQRPTLIASNKPRPDKSRKC